MPVRIPAAQRAPRRGRLRYKPFTFQPSRYLVRTWWLASGELLNFSLAEFHSDRNTGGPEGTPAWTPTLQTFYLPTLAVSGADVVVGFRRVAEFQFGGVPLRSEYRRPRGHPGVDAYATNLLPSNPRGIWCGRGGWLPASC